MSNLFDKYKEIDDQFEKNKSTIQQSSNQKKLKQERQKKQNQSVKNTISRKKRVLTNSNKKINRKEKNWNWLFSTGAIFGFVLSLVAVLYPEVLDSKNLQWPRIRLSQGDAKAEDSPQKASNVAAKKNDKGFFEEMSSLLTPNSAKVTMEKTDLNATLEEKRKELERKERSLQKLADEIETQKTDLETQLDELFTLRRTISSKLENGVENNKENMEKLVGVYSNMKPQRAAGVIAGMNEALATSILSRMKKQNAAAILNFIDPKKARSLSEKYAGIK